MQSSTTKANKKISSARIPGAQKIKKSTAAAVSPSSSSFELEASNVAPSEVEANKASKKVSPPAAPLALEGWGLASYSSSDDDEEKPKPAAAKKQGKASGKPTKGRALSKNRYLLPAAAKQDQKKAEPDGDELIPGLASGIGELLLSSFDPFADAERADEGDGAPRDGAVHLRMQQRNGRKSLTTVQGISPAYNYARILRDLKRDLCCSGIVVEDEDLGSVIQLQGDHRKAVAAFLVKAGMVTKANVKIHGS
jgi:translation initiation factor 1